MHRSFQQWGEDFGLNEDLQYLEDGLAMDVVMAASPMNQALSNTTSVQAAAKATQALPSVERLAQALGERMMGLLCDEGFLDSFLHARELRKDNQLLAAQVQHLLKEKKRLEEEVQQALAKSNQYKNIAGNLYLKID